MSGLGSTVVTSWRRLAVSSIETVGSPMRWKVQIGMPRKTSYPVPLLNPETGTMAATLLAWLFA